MDATGELEVTPVAALLTVADAEAEASPELEPVMVAESEMEVVELAKLLAEAVCVRETAALGLPVALADGERDAEGEAVSDALAYVAEAEVEGDTVGETVDRGVCDGLELELGERSGEPEALGLALEDTVTV